MRACTFFVIGSAFLYAGSKVFWNNVAKPFIREIQLEMALQDQDYSKAHKVIDKMEEEYDAQYAQ